MLFLAVLGLIVLTPSLAAETTPTAPEGMQLTASDQSLVANPIDGFPVLLDGKVLFTIRQGIPGVVTAAERAEVISQRIQAIAQDPQVDPDSLQVLTDKNQSVVLAEDTVLFTVREEDVQVYGLDHSKLAASAVEQIRSEVIDYRERRSLRRLLTALVATILSTLAFFLFLRGLLFFTSRLLTQIRQRREADTLILRFQSTQLLGSGATSYFLNGVIRLLRIGLILLALYLYFLFVLSQFPATESVGNRLLQVIANRLSNLAQGFVAYLPELVTLAVLVMITYYVIEFAKQVITELGRHDVYPWFYPEWVQPTIRLVSLLIMAIAFVVAGPYLPGFGSPAFQGMSIFLGALLTLGSSSAVANALSGIILIYTRAFQLGDFIRIDNTIGEVQDKTLFVTRILTPKQETVTIPNASVLNSNVTNYSAICRESHGYLVLHTTVTLGYDVPWRKIHDVLIAAARATPHIQHEPAPFVLQTNLNDFNVSYELNAFTAYPQKMPVIYSELHQNIQDHCNQAGIEILSPTYSSLRDGNSSTLPADYLPEDYTPPAFVVRGANGQP
ncbi:MAG TPA: mechanosensitive ion channel family protein [Leptolyngbyaceae cyanobacterium M65_K2018_010]|nr:mechanosensitive ion channel family protein [Leptolyngbyaceae cyanobacterium M65_K2018_010]